MPTLYDHNGAEINLEHPDDFALPHVFTFGSIVQGGLNTYLMEKHDEALRHHRENALMMRRDCFLMSLLRERKEGTLRLKWHLETDNAKDPTEQATAAAMTKAVKSVRRLKRLLNWLLEALWYGRYGVQIKWGWQVMHLPVPVYSGPAEAGSPPSVGTAPQKVLLPVDMRPVNGDKLGFRWDGTVAVMAGAGIGVADLAAKGLTTTYVNLAPAILLDKPNIRQRFIVHTYDPDDADYWDAEAASAVFGVGIRARVYWTDYMRREYLSWVTETLERIGLGLVVIYYDASNPAAKAEAEKTAKNYSRRSAILMPRTMDGARQGGAVEVVEAPVAGAQVVQLLVEALEQKEERFIIGQMMSGGADNESGLGGTGRAKFASETKGDRIRADAEDLAETLTGAPREPGLLDTMFRWTLPQLAGKFPLRWTYAIDEDDPDKKLQAIKSAAEIGTTFKEDEVRGLTGMSKPEPDDKVVGGRHVMSGMPGFGGQGDAPQDGENGEGPGGDNEDKPPFGNRPNGKPEANGVH